MSEMSEHRVSMLGASWRRFEDPTRSRDPRVRQLVAALGALPAPELRPEFRDELRAQLVAIAPRIVAEAREAGAEAGAAGKTRRPSPHPGPARHADGWATRLRGVRVGRPLAVAASLITVLALLFGGAVWMSKKALPGDTLYGLKRAGESFELATAGSDGAKARDYLRFATTRANEVHALLSRAGAIAAGRGPQAAGAIDSGTASLIASTLGSADSDVRAASSLLGAQAVHKASAAPLTTLIDWAPGQTQRLKAISDALPASAVRTRVDSSARLVDAALARAHELAADVGCRCLQSSGHDSLGPLPCSTACAPVPATGPGQHRSGSSAASTAPGNRAPGNGPSSGRSGAQPGNGGAGPGTAHGTPTTTPNAPPGGGASSSPGGGPPLPLPSVPIPSLPIKLPISSSPVSVGSCSIGIALGPINIGIGSCPSS
jgi:hypothetical protein